MSSNQEVTVRKGRRTGLRSSMHSDALGPKMSLIATNSDQTSSDTSLAEPETYGIDNIRPSTSGESPRTESEIIVRIEGMDMDSVVSSPISASALQESPQLDFFKKEVVEHEDQEVPEDSDLLGFRDSLSKSLASSASVPSEHSELTSLPPSVLSSKATTPIIADEPKVEAEETQPEPVVEVTAPAEAVVLSAQEGPVEEVAPRVEEILPLNADFVPPVEAAVQLIEEVAAPIEDVVPPVQEEAVPSFVPSPPTKATTSRRIFDVRPRVSIPTDIEPALYAIQCIAAAEHSRLSPYALHQDEYLILREHLTQAQVTTYLNIRNGILRLWLHNPRIGVAREEAVGCAKDSRWFDVASVCYDWLLRRGYINYGCAEVPSAKKPVKRKDPRKTGKVVVVIGAGMSGLGCARQLEGLFQQYAKEFQDAGEELPKVVVLEGRSRLGGRVYSRVIDGSRCRQTARFRGKRHTVECGGMIITGFERGNPLNVLLRGQMALPYYSLRPETTLFDLDGKAVDTNRDLLVEKLYNDCLERVSDYKFKTKPLKLIEGNKDLLEDGRDCSSEGTKTIAIMEESNAALPQAKPVAQQNLAPEVNLVPVSTDRATGKTHVEIGTPTAVKAACKAKSLGWMLKEGITEDNDLKLDEAARHPDATLGSLMDEAITQYQKIIDLTPQDFRLMNWHIANLEYSNATNYNQLSLGGWDIDAGNEWEGSHSMVIGGYQSVPWGLAQSPSKLDIRKDCAVSKITYDAEGSCAAKVECENGLTLDADYVVSTIPLGVLKHGNVEFDPPLPSWKTNAMGRLGFGTLNKVILVFDQAFWDTSRDIFGILRNPIVPASINQTDYGSQRGRCFQWFDVSKTSGVPVLLGLLAGDAGYEAQYSTNDEVVADATSVLRNVYGNKVPRPVQAIVTRWGSDKFARGSYSSTGPSMKPEDYGIMARGIGNLYFAGEHTCGTHPATVHGAYLSGLRAASEVIDAMLGPIPVPVPLIIPRESSTRLSPAMPSPSPTMKRSSGADGVPVPSERATKQARTEAYEAAAWQQIVSEIGPPPPPPPKVVGNAYLLYSKTKFEVARKRITETRLVRKGKAGPNDVRVMLSKMWKEAELEERRPYEEEAAEMKNAYAERLKAWQQTAKEWDVKAFEVRRVWEANGNALVPDQREAPQEQSKHRRGTKVDTYAESEGSDVEMEDLKRRPSA